MTKFILTIAVLLFAAGGSEAVAFLQRYPANYPTRTRRVKFERGRTSATVRGVARTPGIYEYVLTAKAGQQMAVHLTSSNKGVEFSIDGPDGTTLDDALGVDDWSGVLESSGTYTIRLINNRSKVSKSPTYTLEIMIRDVKP